MHRHAPRVLSTRTCVCVCVCVSNRRTPALTFPLANCTDRQPFSSRLPLVRLRLVLSSSSLSLSFLHSPFSFRPTTFCSVSVSSFVDPAWRACLCSQSNTLEHRSPLLDLPIGTVAATNLPRSFAAPSAAPSWGWLWVDVTLTVRVPRGSIGQQGRLFR